MAIRQHAQWTASAHNFANFENLLLDNDGTFRAKI